MTKVFNTCADKTQKKCMRNQCKETLPEIGILVAYLGHTTIQVNFWFLISFYNYHASVKVFSSELLGILCSLWTDLPFSLILPFLLCYIPVFNRPIRKFRFFNVSASPIAGASPIRPAGRISKPIFIWPFKNVPVVSMTVLPPILAPLSEKSWRQRLTFHSKWISDGNNYKQIAEF